MRRSPLPALRTFLLALATVGICLSWIPTKWVDALAGPPAQSEETGAPEGLVLSENSTEEAPVETPAGEDPEQPQPSPYEETEEDPTVVSEPMLLSLGFQADRFDSAQLAFCSYFREPALRPPKAARA